MTAAGAVSAQGTTAAIVTTLEWEGTQVARLANYFFNADFLIDICGELGVPVRANGDRWWVPEVQS